MVKKFNLLIAVALLFFPSVSSGGGFASSADYLLQKNRCTKKADVSISVKSLHSGKILYSKNANQPLTPASNMKIVTSTVALELLKPYYIFETPVSFVGKRKDGFIDGDLVVTGRGDPHLVTEDLFLMANEIRKTGIKRITGNLYLDDSYFEKSLFPSTWHPSKHRRAYEAPLGALSLNFNGFTLSIYASENKEGKPHVAIDPSTPYLTIVNKMNTITRGQSQIRLDYKEGEGGKETVIISGKVRAGARNKNFYRAVKNPIPYFGLTFKRFLEKEGIFIEGKIIHGKPEGEQQELFVYESKPLSRQIAFMNKYSNNFMAEQIVRTIGAEMVSIPGSHKKGLKQIENYLLDSGFDKSKFHLEDGSGFSTGNRLTTSLIIRLLENAYKKWDGGPEFLTSLAVMGHDGSVKDRLAYETRTIRVKTGTLNGVSALSGYYPLKSGDILVFSMIFNKLGCENGDVWSLEHQLLEMMDKFEKEGD